jgi:Uma2 family endonuclease
MAETAARTLTPHEFLVWERSQQDRHIYVRGQVFAMAGGSPRHNGLCAEVIARLADGLRGGRCRVFTSDQKLGLPKDQFVYADAVVVCGTLELRSGTTDVVTNPRVVVEVLSKNTETYDRGDKQQGYLSLPSLEHLVLVSQREPRVEVYTRQTDGSFRFDVVEAGGAVRLERLDLEVDVDALYSGVFELPGD